MSILTCSNLVLGYNKPINQPFDLSIEENLWIGIVGENGVGKSTFLKTILGVIPPLSGNLSIMGSMNACFNPLISYIPQEREINVSPLLSGLSLVKASFNGWKFGLPNCNKNLHEEIIDLAYLVGADEYILQPFSTLSGGQKKRIYLVQALINKPKFLLLDEPLADLDPHARQHFIQALEEIHKYQELSLMIISHDMHEISKHLDGYIHFRGQHVHYCTEIPCVKGDVYVGV